MQFRSLLITAVALLASTVAISQAKYSNEFLKIGVGARALGMANSFTASADDVTSGYWNPAGLTRMEDDLQFSVMHSEYFAVNSCSV